MRVGLTVRGDIQVLRLQPGDKILVTITQGSITPEIAERISEALERNIPGHEVVIVAEGIQLSVARDVVDA